MKTVLCITTLFFVGICLAQTDNENEKKLIIEKGTWNLGGNFSLSFSNNQNENESFFNENKNFSFTFLPNLGYTVKDNFIVGLGLGYGYTKSENLGNNNGEVTSSSLNEFDTFIVFPYIRTYWPVHKNLAFYIQAEGRYDFVKFKNQDRLLELEGPQRTTNQIFLGIRPGITFFISDKLALETSLGSLGYRKSYFSFDNDNSERTSDSSAFNFSLNSSDLLFGLSYYF
ncbi:outer membrane protein [Maribacter sp. 2210JD10-5]|uniref:outer membrane protein n=1 Tax=Maribacter sp. 2210JD10-5 TaxID=3386272 RepID=UPI0039BCFADC